MNAIKRFCHLADVTAIISSIVDDVEMTENEPQLKKMKENGDMDNDNDLKSVDKPQILAESNEKIKPVERKRPTFWIDESNIIKDDGKLSLEKN